MAWWRRGGAGRVTEGGRHGPNGDLLRWLYPRNDNECACATFSAAKPRPNRLGWTLDPDLAGLHPTSIVGISVGRVGFPVDTPNGSAPPPRCLQLVSQQIATMPLRFRGQFEPAWISNPDPAWFPNGSGDAIFAAVNSMYAWGDAFLWVTDRYETGYPRTWTVLDPDRVTVEAGPDGTRRYKAGEYRFDTEDVLQITRNPRGELRGTSALSAYAANVQAAAAAEQYTEGVYSGGGIPPAIIQPKRNVDADQAAEIKAQWMAKVGNGQGPAVVNPDLTFTQFAFNPKDMMLLESREYDAKQIAAAFGVPAFMLNMEQAGGLNYSNPEMLFGTWWRTELYPTARRIEAALSTWLPRGSWCEFDPAILLRPDLKTQSEVWLSLQAAGVVSVDEVRAAVLDLPPLSEGDALALIDEPPGAKTSEPSADTEAAARPPELEVVSYDG